MNINSPFPIDVDALIEQLDRIYPDRAPDIDDSDRAVWMKAGQSSVVAFLRAWRKASLEKHPYVSGQDAQGHPSGSRRQAPSGVHEPLLRGTRSRRRGRKGRS